MRLRDRNRLYHRICRVCGRKLKSKAARKIGFGKKCEKKFQARAEQDKLELRGQLRLPFNSCS